MTRKLRTFRRAARVTGGALLAAVAVGAVASGATSAGGPLSRFATACMALLALGVGAAVVRRYRFEPASVRIQRISPWRAAAPLLMDIELILALLAGSYAVIGATGGNGSPMYPLLYGIIAFAATFLTRLAVWLGVAVVICVEIALWLRAGAVTDQIVIAALHSGFVLAASWAHLLFLRGAMRRLRREHHRRLDHALARQRESARDYRLISSALGADSRGTRNRRDEEMALAAGSAEVVGASVFHTLGLLKRALDARTCVLLWLDERGEHLRVKEACTDVDWIACGARVPLAGALGAALRDRQPVVLSTTRPGQIGYYDGGGAEAVGPLCAVPVADGPHLRGLLCVDRPADGGPWGERDTRLLADAAQQILHAIHAEQVFIAVERAKYEHERFYRASAMLGRALTLEQVMDTAFDAAAEIVEYDLAAITMYQHDTRRHKVQGIRVRPDSAAMIDSEALAELEYRDNAGLVAMVVKNRHYLPVSGELRDDAIPVWTKKIKLRGVESLVVLPLAAADEVVGTLTLASRKRGRFRKDIREMLGVIAVQVATSLENALMYRKMETMATTDGLTNLTNHRTFQERFSNLLERSARHNHRAAILLCDVDHFKNVNDTYGHPVGDEVLRQVARVLKNAVRVIDIPARYGGEEFAVVLEATDLEGALHLAERIREDVGKLEIPSDKGTFKVTMSIGVAAFPGDAREQSVLIERADMALYHAKESGRNRVMSYREFSQSRSRKAS